MSMQDIVDLYPLSPTQQGMFVHSVAAPHSEVYVVQLSYAIHGQLQLAELRRAWEMALDRHTALRSSFHWEALEQPLQVVHQHVTLPLTIHDWRERLKTDLPERLDAFLTEDRRRGFDLSEAPLMRITIIRVSDEDYHLVWTQHHLLMDGWSLAIVLKDVMECYTAGVNGQVLQLPPGVPYGDYIAWLQDQDLTGAEAFWRQRLAGFTAPTALRVERLAGTASGQGIHEQKLCISADATAALQAFGRQHQLTLNTLVQGTWALLLHHYSGEDDIVFGSTVAGRPADLPSVESMVGLFINTLPVRVQLDGEATALAWLHALQMQQAESRQYEHSPLVQVHGWSEVPRGQNLFDSILVFESYPMDESLQEWTGDLGIRDIRATVRTNYPLTIVAEPGKQLVIRVEYDQSRYDSDTISRMLGHVQTLLEALPAHAEGRVRDIPLLTAAERTQLLETWNETDAPFPMDLCLHHLFEQQAERVPLNSAVAYGGVILSYQDLNRRANQLAQWLRTLGVQAESLVGIYMERSVEMVVAILGVLKAGGAYVPLDPAYPRERLTFMVSDASLAILLTQECLRNRLPTGEFQVISLDGEQAACDATHDSNLDAGVRPDNLAYVIYTSGSTGTPKGALIEHQGVVNYLTWAIRNYQAGEGNGAPVHSSLAFDLTVTSLFTPLLSGRCVHLVPDGDRLESLASALQTEQQFSLVKITPAHLEVLSEMLPATSAAHRTNALVIGGEQLLAEQLRFWQQNAPGTRLINEYGPTETVVGCCVYEVAPGETATGPVPIGRPIANTQLYVLNKYNQPVPVGVPGELYIGGAGVARGYLNRPELTHERFVASPFTRRRVSRLYRTGDLARYRPDGILEFLGRIDHQVKVRGYRIELGEIEAVLSQHPDIREAIVMVRAEGASEKRLVAYLVSRGAALTVSHLRAFLAEKLPEYMVPSAFVQLHALPLTANGKVDRRALPAPDQERPELMEAFIGPRNENEQRLAAIWKEILGLEQVGVDDNFFELGGDSILGIQVVARANQMGFQLSPGQLFQHPTVAELAALGAPASVAAAEADKPSGAVPLTPIQHWFFRLDLPDRHHFNQSVFLEVDEPLDHASVRKALRQLVDHHDALRLRFTRTGSGWVQEYGAEENDLLIVVDLSGLPAEEHLAALERKAAEIQGSLDLTEGPLLRVGLFERGVGRSSYLLIVVHHLVIDGVSWRVLVEDLQHAYGQAVAGHSVSLPQKTASYQRWAEQLAEHVASGVPHSELGYWLTLPWEQVGRMPVDRAGAVNREDSADTVSVWLSPEGTDALLHKVSGAYHTQINDILLAALVLAFSRWTGNRTLLLDLEGHGREDLFEGVNVARTVGWFTSIFPVVLQVENAWDPGDVIRTVKEQLRHIPNRGIGYGMLRYRSEDAEVAAQLTALPQAEVAFNYLGQFDQLLPDASAFRLANASAGPTRGPRGVRSHLIAIDGMVVGGRLQVIFTYSRNLHQLETVEQLALDYAQELRGLIEHCCSAEAGAYTPSDFPLADLDQSELNQILAKVTKNRGSAGT